MERGSLSARATNPIPKINRWQRPVPCATNPVRFAKSGRTTNFLRPKLMSQHRSLRAASTSGAKRNVLKRYERVELLKKRGQWKTGDRVTGLRKTKPDA